MNPKYNYYTELINFEPLIVKNANLFQTIYISSIFDLEKINFVISCQWRLVKECYYQHGMSVLFLPHNPFRNPRFTPQAPKGGFKTPLQGAGGIKWE